MDSLKTFPDIASSRDTPESRVLDASARAIRSAVSTSPLLGALPHAEAGGSIRPISPIAHMGVSAAFDGAVLGVMAGSVAADTRASAGAGTGAADDPPSPRYRLAIRSLGRALDRMEGHVSPW